MSASLLWAIAAGVGLGIGLVTLFFALPVMNQPRLKERVAPYVAGVLVSAPEPASRPLQISGAARIFAPLVAAAVSQLDRFSLNTDQLRRRLRHADMNLSVSDYRLQQVLCAAAGVVIALMLNVLMFLAGNGSVLFAAFSVPVTAVCGVLLRDYLLSERVSRRRKRMLTEFPTIAELLALAVSAGESAPGAFERIGRSSTGLLAAELNAVIQQTRTGESFGTAVRNLNQRIEAAPIARFLEGILIALERGTPLAEVMRAQAADVRELSKRELMEAAGRKEIAMLVPLVFGILPLTVIFAVYPGLELLSIGL